MLKKIMEFIDKKKIESTLCSLKTYDSLNYFRHRFH